MTHVLSTAHVQRCVPNKSRKPASMILESSLIFFCLVRNWLSRNVFPVRRQLVQANACNALHSWSLVSIYSLQQQVGDHAGYWFSFSYDEARILLSYAFHTNTIQAPKMPNTGELYGTHMNYGTAPRVLEELKKQQVYPVGGSIVVEEGRRCNTNRVNTPYLTNREGG